MTNLNQSLAYLIEGELQKAELVIAAKSITDKLQKMAESLAKVEADDVMPLLDQMKTAFGPQATDRFSQTVTAKVRELLDVVKSAKDAIDTDITGLETGNIATNDMGSDQFHNDAPADDLGDAGASGTIGGSAPKLPSGDVGPDVASDEFDQIPNGGAAGRAKKESATYRLTPAMRALRETKNPDELILKTFRRKLSEGQTARCSVISTARLFSIDLHDVVSIVKEAKDASKPASAKKNKEGKVGKRPFDKQASIDEAKQKEFRAKLNRDTLWFDIVDNTGKVVADSVAVNAKRAKEIADKFHEETLVEAIPVKPLSPADSRAAKAGQPTQQQVQQNAVQQVQKAPQASPNGQSPTAPKSPQAPVKPPAAPTQPNLPGNVLKTAPNAPAAPPTNGTQPPTTPKQNFNPNAPVKPVNANVAPTTAIKPTPTSVANGSASPASTNPVNNSATPALNGQNVTNSAPTGELQTPSALFGKNKPLPLPASPLAGTTNATESRHYRRKVGG